MTYKEKWQRCICNKGKECARFIDDYFTKGKKVLIICGAGFDPRSTVIPLKLSESLGGESIEGIFIREERDEDNSELKTLAETNELQLASAIKSHIVRKIDIFSGDTAVIGGREAAKEADRINLHKYSDVVIDLSALSVGVAFPMIKLIVQKAGKIDDINVHLFAASNSEIDGAIEASFSDVVIPIHGFDYDFELSENDGKATLWMPQLAFDQKYVLRKIYEKYDIHDVCPIVPFPANDPRIGDKLLVEYTEELLNVWSVDHRNLVYAADDDPLDMYRVIVKTNKARSAVFSELGGSITFISPVGSKILSIGALMASMAENLPLYYMEPISYSMRSVTGPKPENYLAHVWLEGNVYRAFNS